MTWNIPRRNVFSPIRGLAITSNAYKRFQEAKPTASPVGSASETLFEDCRRIIAHARKNWCSKLLTFIFNFKHKVPSQALKTFP